MDPKLIQSIRTYIGDNQQELADSVGVSKPTIVRMESGGPQKDETVAAILSYFKSHNIEVLQNPSGMIVRDEVRDNLKGRKGFHAMYRQMYAAIRKGNPDLWLYNGISHLVANALGDEFIQTHRKTMQSLEGQFNWRVVVEEGDDAFWGNQYAYYKWIPKKYFNNKTIYVFGDTVAIVDFTDDITINLTHSADVAETMRLFLETTWEAKAYDPNTEKPFRPE